MSCLDPSPDGAFPTDARSGGAGPVRLHRGAWLAAAADEAPRDGGELGAPLREARLLALMPG